MRTTVVIPTYWGRKKEIGWREGDAVYDHPTPIDEEGTLGRTLESMKILKNKDFKLIILICPTTDEVEKEAQEKVKKIIGEVRLGIETYIFTVDNLREIKEICINRGLNKDVIRLLNLKGYANVRNMCLYASHILSSEVTILIDDDEIFENPDFIDMAKEFIGKRVYGENIYGVAGYYLNKHDEYYDDVNMEPWMTYWDRFGSKAKAFDKIISCGPRIKHTPFAFGGAMVIHKNMYQVVPFDPNITRGEDIDYLINARMFGFHFYLDNKLSIKHLPPKKNHPVWQRFREDIYRFLYERTKIRSQYEVSNMQRVDAEDFDPYPGEFLKNDLEDKIYKTNVLLALEYLAEGKVEACKESIKNIFISKYEAIPKRDPFTEYRHIQKSWEKLIDFTIQNKMEIRKIVEKNNLSRNEANIDETHYRKVTLEEKKEVLKRIDDFKSFTDEELEKLAQISRIKVYKEDEIIFREGEKESSFYIILKGCISVFKYNERNEEIVLGKICSGGVMGETAIVNKNYYVNAKAMEFVELLIIEQVQIEELIKKDLGIAVKLLQMFVDKLSFKLEKTNKLYADYILQTSRLQNMD
jgi:CRP-like cAMP-binding protein